MTVQVLQSGSVDLTDQEEKVINLVRNHGYKVGYETYLKNKSARQWRRVKQSLIVKNINLEALENSELRINEDERTDQLEYKLVLVGKL